MSKAKAPVSAGPPPPRAVIEGVTPEIDAGRFPVKRAVGESVVVEADVFGDGHDALGCELLHRPESQPEWLRVPMHRLHNDRWRGSFEVDQPGRHVYTLRAWIDHFATWRHDLGKRVEAGQDVRVDLRIGAELVEAAAARAGEADGGVLREDAARLRGEELLEDRVTFALSEQLAERACRWPDLRAPATYRELVVVVDRLRARFSAWYEMFPRSASAKPGGHGTLRDVEQRLPYVAELGFDVLYLPPIHPIGVSHRKGRNNAVSAEPGDCGSPWAIGSAEGGHRSVHPELGGLDDVSRLARKAAGHGIELALDLAFQCSPDHPYVAEHPAWFRRRPDGTVQYAENPPKKYEDIYPFDFESSEWRALWDELEAVIEFWVKHGVRIFRVDNPHTKPFAFWEEAIGRVQRRHPDVIFLAEAFTRPKVMYRLAKLGFTQSYTYFAWRHTAAELREYMTELTATEVAEYFRPNFWPNTPDILTETLQFGGRPAFVIRLVLAATLAASYGIYGPAYELVEREPREPGGEEYLDSEKYEIRSWDLDAPHSLRELIAVVNRIRRDNPALHSNQGLRFHDADNERLLVYSKATGDLDNVVLSVVNLDPHHAQAGWIDLDLDELGLEDAGTYQVHDLLSGARYLWSGRRNYVELDPASTPAHVFRVRRRIRTERDFDYFL